MNLAAESNAPTRISPRPLSRLEASDYLFETYGIRRKAITLAKMACVSSTGPKFRKANRAVLYSVADLDEWAASVLSPICRSTSDLPVVH